ncbi:MAG: hypothetical protein K5784_10450 [Clostridiales bacterium]|nr:hypothetical protein [Clostridiales bacterium]
MKKLIAIMTVMFLVSFCFAEAPALTVNGTELDPGYVSACMFLTFRSYDDTVQYYDSTLGINYWDLEYDDGSTVFDRVKADGFKNLVMQTVLCSYSDDLGIILDTDDLSEISSQAETISADSGFPREKMIEALTARELSQRVYGALVSAQNVDADSVLSGVNKADYSLRAQYLFIPYSAYREDAETKAACCELLSSLSRFGGDYKQAAKFNPGVEVGEFGLSELDGELRRTAVSLSESVPSDVIDTDLGLFVLRALPLSGSDDYRDACEMALHEAKEKAFQKEYEKLYREAEYTMDGAFWDSLTPPEIN